MRLGLSNLVLDYIRYKQLNRYGHVQRMDEERLPRKILEYYYFTYLLYGTTALEALTELKWDFLYLIQF